MVAQLPMLRPSPPVPAPARAALHAASPSRRRLNSALFGIVTHRVAARRIVHPGVESPAAAAGAGAIPQRWRVGPCPPAAQQHRRGSRPRWMAAVQPPPDGCAPALSSGAPTASPPALDAAEPPAPLAGWESPPAGWGGGRAASPDGWLAGRAGCRPGWLGLILRGVRWTAHKLPLGVAVRRPQPSTPLAGLRSREVEGSSVHALVFCPGQLRGITIFDAPRYDRSAWGSESQARGLRPRPPFPNPAPAGG